MGRMRLGPMIFCAIPLLPFFSFLAGAQDGLPAPSLPPEAPPRPCDAWWRIQISMNCLHLPGRPVFARLWPKPAAPWRTGEFNWPGCRSTASACSRSRPGTKIEEALLTPFRESLGRPVVRMDLIHLLDDILREGRRGLRGQRVWITPGRTRSRGILLHPDDIFEGNPCRYGERGFLEIDEPRAQVDLPPARDGDPPGPAWAMCNRNSSGETELLGVLGEKRSGDDPGPRIRSLIE